MKEVAIVDDIAIAQEETKELLEILGEWKT